jgi:predicted nucleic acid-binding protein
LLDLPNTKMVQVYYHLHLITADSDDDKFVDCAFKANAKYIVTQDHHYDVLRNIPFPKIEVVDIDEFLSILR